MTPDPKLAPLLRDLLVAHGIPAELRDGWVATDDTGPAIRGASFPCESDSIVTRQLDFQVALPDGRLLTESCAGIGATEDEAARSGVEKFTASALHPILCAFFGHRPGDDDITETTLAGSRWNVLTGPDCFETWSAPGQEDAGEGQIEVPGDYAARIHELIHAHGVADHDVHWLRFFVGSLEGSPLTTEALWNGSEWPEATAALAALPWSKRAGYYSLRTFVILQRAATEPEPRGKDFRSVLAAVEHFARLCKERQELDQDGLAGELAVHGVHPEVVDDILSFTPPAFSKRLFLDLPLPDEYTVAGPQGTRSKPRRLDGRPAFLAGRLLADRLANEDKDGFFAVASRCAWCSLVNDALNQGVTMEKLQRSEFQPLLVTGAEGAGSGEISEAPRRRARRTRRSPKVWWQFWK